MEINNFVSFQKYRKARSLEGQSDSDERAVAAMLGYDPERDAPPWQRTAKETTT